MTHADRRIGQVKGMPNILVTVFNSYTSFPISHFSVSFIAINLPRSYRSSFNMYSLSDTISPHEATQPDRTKTENATLPELRDDYVLIKIHTEALNPSDRYAAHISKLSLTRLIWLLHRKHFYLPALTGQNRGCAVGCDCIGTVVRAGSRVVKNFKRGDHIAGFTHGADSAGKEEGCFDKYGVAKGSVQMQVSEPTELKSDHFRSGYYNSWERVSWPMRAS